MAPAQRKTTKTVTALSAPMPMPIVQPISDESAASLKGSSTVRLRVAAVAVAAAVAAGTTGGNEGGGCDEGGGSEVGGGGGGGVGGGSAGGG